MASQDADPAGSGGAPVRPTERPALLAGGLLAGAGLIDVVAGLGLIRGDPYLVVTERNIYLLDVTGWLVLHDLVGAATAVAGLIVVADRRWTASVGISAALAGIALHLLVFPYHPVRAVAVSLLDACAIRLLVRRRRRLRQRPGEPITGRHRSAR